jgi:DNA-binding PadR family transcriptional regulator
MRADDEDVRKLLPLKPLDFSILVALAEEERYGYSLAKRVAEEGGGAIRLPPSNLYHVLDRLIESGLIRVTERADQEDERRRYFGLTELGRKAAAAEARRLQGVMKTARDLDLAPRDQPS